MVKYVKNADTVTHTWGGTDISAGSYYQITDGDARKFSEDSQLITDISNGIAIMATTNDGTGDITDVSEAIDFLKDNLPKKVVSALEQGDISLRLTCVKKQSDTSGYCEVKILVPGTANPTNDTANDGRWLAGGVAYFESCSVGDRFEVSVVDYDNIAGYGAGVQVGTYTEDYSSYSSNTINEAGGGMYSDSTGRAFVRAIDKVGFVGSGYYILVKGWNKSGTQENMYVNIEWGVKK